MNNNNNSGKGSSKLITTIISIIAVIAAAIFGGNFLLGDDDSNKTVSLSNSSVAFTQEASDEKSEENLLTEPDIDESQTETAPVEESAGGTDTAEETSSAYVEYYFASRKLLDSHFEKHGSEFDGLYATAEEYEKGASDVINNPDALQKTEQEDGDFIFYIEDTNEFVVLSTSGFIRTYFKPSAGKKYYDKQ